MSGEAFTQAKREAKLPHKLANGGHIEKTRDDVKAPLKRRAMRRLKLRPGRNGAAVVKPERRH